MDTKTAAEAIGTTPRTLRQFLRSPISTFVAVGSGSRYEFTEADIPMLHKRFREWEKGGKSKKTRSVFVPPAVTDRPATPLRTPQQPSKKDRAVWKEEGAVVIEDIRNPRVRQRMLADARAAEDRLMMLLMSKGMHVSQLGDQRKAS